MATFSSSSSSVAVETARLFKDQQLKAAVNAEKQRFLSTRRVALTDLHNKVADAAEACKQRKQQMNMELGKLAAAQRDVEERRRAREEHCRTQQLQLQRLVEEEQLMENATNDREQMALEVFARLQQAKTDSERLPALIEMLSRLRAVKEQQDQNVREYEAHIDQLRQDTLKRHAEAGKDLPQIHLPNVSENVPDADLTALGAESTVLVDEGGAY